jgi:DNA-binding CsgD family transcriptional regulator
MILLAMNIFPVIWLRIFFTNCFIEERLVKEDKLLIDQVVRKYGFSDREKEIMALIIEGKSNKEIEEQLFISFHTVKNHIYNIFKKCGVNSRSQLIHLVMKQK